MTASETLALEVAIVLMAAYAHGLNAEQLKMLEGHIEVLKEMMDNGK